ncbi:MAG: hypothetical protein IJZ94_04740 [Clostridia bacterium]|nr:hypothetical protein [Clostridia bacterium]MBQ8165103.1 hypothetical protein [Clostridia bacterium]
MKKIVSLILAIGLLTSMGILSVSADTGEPVWSYYPNYDYIGDGRDSWAITADGNGSAVRSADDSYVTFTANAAPEAHFYVGWAAGDLTASMIPTIDASSGNVFVLKCRLSDSSKVGEEGDIIGQLVAASGACVVNFDYDATTEWQYVLIDCANPTVGSWTGTINFLRLDYANSVSVNSANLEGFSVDIESLELFTDRMAAQSYIDSMTENTDDNNNIEGENNGNAENDNADNTGNGNTDNIESDNIDNIETDDSVFSASIILVILSCTVAVLIKKRTYKF